jgi:hypothetical protein
MVDDTHLVDARTMFLKGAQAFHGNVQTVAATFEDIGKATPLNRIADVANVYVRDEEGGWKGGVPQTELDEDIDHAAAGLMTSVSQI